jgi:hypothetical protein
MEGGSEWGRYLICNMHWGVEGHRGAWREEWDRYLLCNVHWGVGQLGNWGWQRIGCIYIYT